MGKSQLMVLVIGSALCSLITPSLHADEFWTRNPGWLAAFWQTAPDTGKSLGIDAQKVEGEYPAKLHLSNFVDKQAAVEVMGAEAIKLAEDRFTKMDHKLVQAGKWEVNPGCESFADKDEFFFVTTSDGATFLWFGTPQLTLKGAELHYINGVDPSHDILILDFGFSKSRGRLKAGNAIVYRRTKDWTRDIP